jgi:hypothetical protein
MLATENTEFTEFTEFTEKKQGEACFISVNSAPNCLEIQC